MGYKFVIFTLDTNKKLSVIWSPYKVGKNVEPNLGGQTASSNQCVEHICMIGF